MVFTLKNVSKEAGRNLAALTMGLCASLPCLSPAQADPIDNNPMNQSLSEARTEEPLGFTQGSFVVAPIPFKNVLIGGGLALGGGYLFKMDDKSDTSILGFGAMRSENGSNAYGLGGTFAFHDNRWQLSATAAQAEAYYDLYIGTLPVPVRQTGDLFKATLLYGVTPEILLGGGFRYMDTALSYDSTAGGLPPLPESTLDLARLSLIGKWDTRDDTFSARAGHLLSGEIAYGDVLNVDGRDYQKATLSYSGYHPLGDLHSFAYNISACGASDQTPFFENCSLGGTDGFRGYSPTEFLDSALASAQIEYRHKLSARFGAVLFAGAGATGPSFNALDDGGMHYAGGLGLRFQLSKEFKAVFSVDVSINDREEDLLYIYVGHRF